MSDKQFVIRARHFGWELKYLKPIIENLGLWIFMASPKTLRILKYLTLSLVIIKMF